MSIQNSVNQVLGTAAIATKLSPQLQELGEEVRTSTESNRVDKQLKKLASKGYVDYDPEKKDRYIVLDSKNMFKYDSLIEKKRMLNNKKRALGLVPTYFRELPSHTLGPDEAADLEEEGILQRESVERLKEVKNKMRDSQFGGKNYGKDKQ